MPVCTIIVRSCSNAQVHRMRRDLPRRAKRRRHSHVVCMHATARRHAAAGHLRRLRKRRPRAGRPAIAVDCPCKREAPLTAVATLTAPAPHAANAASAVVTAEAPPRPCLAAMRPCGGLQQLEEGVAGRSHHGGVRGCLRGRPVAFEWSNYFCWPPCKALESSWQDLARPWPVDFQGSCKFFRGLPIQGLARPSKAFPRPPKAFPRHSKAFQGLPKHVHSTTVYSIG